MAKYLDKEGLETYEATVKGRLKNKQDTLVSGTNIKTINNTSLLGSGNITVGGGTATDVKINGTSITSNDEADIQTYGTYNATTNKIATMSDLPTVPTKVSDLTNDAGYTTNTGTITSVKMNGSTVSSSGEADLGTVLTSHQNIKTINSTSLVGTGNVSVQPTLVSGTNIKTINSTSLLGSGDISVVATETDPVFTASAAHGITSTDITNWNNKSTFSGNYNDLTNKPTIPDELSDLSDDSTHRLVTDTEKTTWNNKSDFSGSYNDLTNKPSIPTNLENGTGTGSLKTTSAYSATGNYSFAEGRNAMASGNWSHAEGSGSTASGGGSHAEGMNSIASGEFSHAEGASTTAASDYQHVEGTYNIVDSNDTYIHIVGNGDDNNNRSNAYTLDWSGNGVYAGKLTVGTGPTNNMDVATKQYVDSSIPTNVSAFTNDSGYVTDAVTGDLTSLTTTTKTDLVSAINEVNKKDIITVYVTSTYTASSAADYIPNSLTINSQLGNKLSVSGGNVVIGSGVSKILVSGTAVLSLSGSGSKIRNFSIRKNDTNQKTASENFNHTGWAKISITSALIDVEEGDTIKIQSYLQSGDKLNGGSAYTYITLEVVEYS